MKIANNFLKENVNIEDFASEFEEFCLMLQKEGIVMTYKQEMKEFLNCEFSPKLTDDERVILKNIDLQNFKAIGRKDDYLYLRYTDYTFEYGETDIKTLTFWYMYHDLFKFIQNGEEYSIEELLNGTK